MLKHLDLTIAERVRFVYQEVWHEFFDWEQEYCRQMLTHLNQSSTMIQSPVSGTEGSKIEHSFTEETASTVADCVRLWLFDSETDISTEVLSCPTYSCTTLERVDAYEACTYSHKNLYVADDPCEKLPFMPFSDDPRFPAAELFELYESMGWESRRDPDRALIDASFFPLFNFKLWFVALIPVDIVLAEAVRRLHFGFGISFADIDDTGILPTSIIERPDKKGLLHMLSQRYVSQIPPG